MTAFLPAINAGGPLHQHDGRATEIAFLASSDPRPLTCAAGVNCGLAVTVKVAHAVNKHAADAGGSDPDWEEQVNSEQMY